MTATFERPKAEQIHATDADIRRAVQRALASAGATYDQLAAQARRGDFESMNARVAWIAVRDLEQFAK